MGGRQLPIWKAQPEHIIDVQLEWFDGPQQHNVTDVKFNHPHIFTVKQDWVLNIFAHYLQQRKNIHSKYNSTEMKAKSH